MSVENKHPAFVAKIELSSRGNQGETALGKTFTPGNPVTRVAIQVFKALPPIEVAIKNLSEKEMAKELEELKGNTLSAKWKRYHWAPLIISTKKGSKTVLVNINSLAKRLGISKPVARNIVFATEKTGDLAGILTQMQQLESQSKLEPAKIIKIVNFIEKHRENWTKKLATQESVTFSHVVHPIPYSITIFKEGKIGIHLHHLGAGSFKQVDAVIDYNKHKKLALSQLKPFSEELSEKDKKAKEEEMANEVNLHLKYPNTRGIVKTFEMRKLAVVDGKLLRSQPVILQKCYEGTLEGRKNLNIEDKARIAIDTALGLAKLHKDGIAHRDIKTANIFVTRDENNRAEADIGDLGEATSVGQKNFNKFTGTLAYMSPELVSNPGSAKSLEFWQRNDVWQLGCVYYEMLTGTIPYWSEECNKMLRDDYNPFIAGYKIREMNNPESYACVALGNHLEAVCNDPNNKLHVLVKGMLNPDPKKRFTMDQVLEILNLPPPQ